MKKEFDPAKPEEYLEQLQAIKRSGSPGEATRHA
jgi:hypothetical protein